jgi:hypothetical protein
MDRRRPLARSYSMAVILPAGAWHARTAPFEHGHQVAAQTSIRHRDIYLVRKPPLGFILHRMACARPDHAGKLSCPHSGRQETSAVRYGLRVRTGQRRRMLLAMRFKASCPRSMGRKRFAIHSALTFPQGRVRDDHRGVVRTMRWIVLAFALLLSACAETQPPHCIQRPPPTDCVVG